MMRTQFDVKMRQLPLVVIAPAKPVSRAVAHLILIEPW